VPLGSRGDTRAWDNLLADEKRGVIESVVNRITVGNEVLGKRFSETLQCFLDLVEAAKHYPGLKKQWVEFLGEHPDHATDRVETSDTAAA
jgi:hypothetical protein